MKIAKLVWMQLKSYLRDPVALFFTLGLPAMFLLVFGAIFKNDNVDFVPLGDIASTVELLCVSNPDVTIAFTESDENDTFSFESQKIRDILGDVPMDAPEVRKWIREYLTENTEKFSGGNRR